VSGGPELEPALEELRPLTLLTAARGDETVCLLALAPDRVPAFGRLARELAVAETITRVEAEPHL
jgi:hypothetical protein